MEFLARVISWDNKRLGGSDRTAIAGPGHNREISAWQWPEKDIILCESGYVRVVFFFRSFQSLSLSITKYNVTPRSTLNSPRSRCRFRLSGRHNQQLHRFASAGCCVASSFLLFVRLVGCTCDTHVFKE